METRRLFRVIYDKFRHKVRIPIQLQSAAIIFLAVPALLSADPPPSTGSLEPETGVAPAQAATNTEKSGQDTGMWKFSLLFASTLTYDNNIFISPTNKKSDYYVNIDPTFAVGLGNFREALTSFAPIPHFLVRTGEEDLPWKDYIYASYTPDGVIFSKYHSEDALNHDARLSGQKERDLWTLNGDLHFQTESDPVIDVGRRIKQTYYTGNANATYALSGKLTGGVRLYGNRSEYTGGFSSTDGRAGGYLDYQVAPKTAVGVGLTGGYLDAARGANQTYEQPQLEIKYLPTEKLSFSGQTGAEFRQFDSGVKDRTHFIFDLQGDYEPADGTSITLDSRRETTASAEYTGQNIVESIYQAGVRQRFLQRIYISVDGGLVHNQYENNEVNTSVARRDDYYFYKISSSSDVTRYGTVALSYEHRKNDSTLAAFGFSEDLATFAVSFLF